MVQDAPCYARAGVGMIAYYLDLAWRSCRRSKALTVPLPCRRWRRHGQCDGNS